MSLDVTGSVLPSRCDLCSGGAFCTLRERVSWSWCLFTSPEQEEAVEEEEAGGAEPEPEGEAETEEANVEGTAQGEGMRG